MLIVYSAVLLVGPFFTNTDQVDYSCSKCRKLYCRECLPNMLVKECKYPPFGYARRHFCSELCLRVQRRHHFCVSECHVFKVRCREPEYPDVLSFAIDVSAFCQMLVL